MKNGKPTILVTRSLPREVENIMDDLFDSRFNVNDVPMTAEEIVKSADEVDALVPTVTDNLNAHLISQLPNSVKLIANFGVGINHIDIAYANSLGIVVTNTPDVLTEDTADLTVALLLAAPRRIVEGDRMIRSGNWEGWSPTSMVGHRVSGKKLGIIGMGRIGQAVARRALGFRMEINYHNRSKLPINLEQSLHATYWRQLDDMLPQMDFISINCPLTDETRYLINEERLERLRPNAFIINTARGEIIDERVLARHLSLKTLSGAALDVYEREPTLERVLLNLDNVVLSPHLGSATREGRADMGKKVITNLQSFFANKVPENIVVYS